MVNVQYKLTAPLSIEAFYQDIDAGSCDVVVKPEMLSICKADIRYYFGMRDAKILKKRLPLSLIHEACGTVLQDKRGILKKGDRVILLPNIPGKNEAYEENYRLDSRFRSSRADGFMQEMLAMPSEQLVPYHNIRKECAAIIEFISVGVHAVNHYMNQKKYAPKRAAVWGDGALGYVVSSLLKHYMPDIHLTVIGVSRNKLDLFQFADSTKTVDEIAEGACFDDAFECVGGQASSKAISQMIDTLLPQGMITLMGVSEEPVPVNTRMVLEKGITMIGRSRSTKEDFEKAVDILEHNQRFADRIALLISDVVAVNCINDIHKAFNQSRIVDYKLVLEWNL